MARLKTEEFSKEELDDIKKMIESVVGPIRVVPLQELPREQAPQSTQP